MQHDEDYETPELKARRAIYQQLRAVRTEDLIATFKRQPKSDLQLTNINIVKACKTTGIHLQVNDERGGYFIRCKKANRQLLSSNYPTQHAMDFHDPQVDMFGGVSRLELVYVIDKEEICIEKVALVKRIKDLVIWSHDFSVHPIQLEDYRHQEDQIPETHGEVAKRVLIPKRANADTGTETERKYANDHPGVSKHNSP